MSLTSTLLLNLPIRLPVGNLRCISSGDQPRCTSTIGQQAIITRNEETRLANIEVVFSAVAAGAETIPEIVIKSGVSISTVNKALHYLGDCGRIERDSRKSIHRFTVKA